MSVRRIAPNINSADPRGPVIYEGVLGLNVAWTWVDSHLRLAYQSDSAGQCRCLGNAAGAARDISIGMTSMPPYRSRAADLRSYIR